MIAWLLAGALAGEPPRLVDVLYGERDWPALAIEARRSVLAGEPDQLLLAAAWARTDRWDRADTLLRQHPGEAADALEAWLWCERDPWVGLVMLQQLAPEDPQRVAWRDDLWLRQAIEVGQYQQALQRAETRGDLDVEALRQSLRRRRSPAVGALASALLPGSGQALAGSWVGASSALLLNAGLFAATGYAIHHRQWGSVAAVGLLGFGFYFGNIYGGADAAVQFNRARRAEALDVLDRHGIRETPPPLR